MGKVAHLRNQVEPFVALFWAFGMVLANTWPCPPAWHGSTTEQSAWPYKDMLCSILNEDTLALFLSRYVIYLWVQRTFCAVWAIKMLLKCFSVKFSYLPRKTSRHKWLFSLKVSQFSRVMTLLCGFFPSYGSLPGGYMPKQTKFCPSITQPPDR